MLSELFLLKSNFVLWPEKPEQVLRSPLIFWMLIRCAHPCSNCIVIFSVVYCLHSVTPFKCAAKPHRQQRPHYQTLLHPHQKGFFLLIACSIAWALSSGCCFPSWQIKAQEMGTARAGRPCWPAWVWGHGLLPAEFSVLRVFLRSLRHLVTWW